MFIKSPRQGVLTHGSSTSLLPEPRSLKTLVTAGVSYCPARDYPAWSSSHGYKLSADAAPVPQERGGWYCNSLPGKEPGIKECYDTQEGLILQCRRYSAGACGQSRSWEAAPLGLFTADTSLLAEGTCVQVVYDPSPESGEYLEFWIWFEALLSGLGIFVHWIFSYRRLARATVALNSFCYKDCITFIVVKCVTV